MRVTRTHTWALRIQPIYGWNADTANNLPRAFLAMATRSVAPPVLLSALKGCVLALSFQRSIPATGVLYGLRHRAAVTPRKPDTTQAGHPHSAR